jgi:hypothetical protein
MKPLAADISFGFQMSTVCTLLHPDDVGSAHHTAKKEVLLTPSVSLLNPYNDTISRTNESYEDCYTSSFIVLRKRYMSDKVYKDILMCILTQYDAGDASDTDNDLMKCFEKDKLTGGAMCLQVLRLCVLHCHVIRPHFNKCYVHPTSLVSQVLLTDCFAKHASNQLKQEQQQEQEPSTVPLRPPELSSDDKTSVTSSLMTFHWQSERASHWQLQPLMSTESVLNCFVRNVLAFFKAMSTTYPDLINMCTEAYNYDPVQDVALSNIEHNNEFHISAIWLGRNLGEVSGSPSEASRANVPFTKWESERSALDWLVPQRATVLHSLVNHVESRMCRPIAGHPMESSGGSSCSSFDTAVLSNQPRPRREGGSNSSGVPGQRERSRIGKSCSINFVIPGFMKCATSFLFEGMCLLWHSIHLYFLVLISLLYTLFNNCVLELTCLHSSHQSSPSASCTKRRQFQRDGMLPSPLQRHSPRGPA